MTLGDAHVSWSTLDDVHVSWVTLTDVHVSVLELLAERGVRREGGDAGVEVDALPEGGGGGRLHLEHPTAAVVLVLHAALVAQLHRGGGGL